MNRIKFILEGKALWRLFLFRREIENAVRKHPALFCLRHFSNRRLSHSHLPYHWFLAETEVLYQWCPKSSLGFLGLSSYQFSVSHYTDQHWWYYY